MNDYLEKQKKLQQRQEQMAVEDQKVIEQFRQMPGQFDTGKKETLSRQYRNRMIYRALQEPDQAAYGRRQPAADYIRFQLQQRRAAGNTQDATLEGSTLKKGRCLLHLAGSQLLSKEVDNELLIRLSDCMMAGDLWADGENPNAVYYEKLHAQGNELLTEIYCRQLEAMDQKYGLKLTQMTAAEQLKALPELEADMLCLKDMEAYFEVNGFPGNAEEQIKIKNKVTYYSKVWSIMQERAAMLEDCSGDEVTEKGELSKKAANEFRSKMKALEKIAKKGNYLKPRKKRMDLHKMLVLDEVRERAQRAYDSYEARRAEEERCQSEFDARVQAMSDQKAELGGFLQALEIYNRPDVDAVTKERAQRSINSYQGLTAEQAQAQIAQLQRKIEEELAKAEDNAEPLITNETQYLERCRNTTERFTRLRTLYRSCRDDQFPEHYGQMLQEYEFLNERYKILRNHPMLSEVLKSENKYSTEFAKESKALNEIVRELPDFSEVVKLRMNMILRSGVANKSRHMEKEDLYLKHKHLLETYREYQEEPMSFDKALAGTIPSVDLWDKEYLDYKVLKKQLERMKVIAAFKQSNPDYYRLGLKEEQWRKAEQMCKILPHFERLLTLNMRYLQIADRNGQAMEEIRQEIQNEHTILTGLAGRFENLGRSALRERMITEMDSLSRNQEVVIEQLKKDEILKQDEHFEYDLTILRALQCGVFISNENAQTAHQDFMRFRQLLTWRETKNKNGITDADVDAAAAWLMQFTDLYQTTVQPLLTKSCQDWEIFEKRAELERGVVMGYFLKDIFSTEKGNLMKAHWEELNTTQMQAGALMELDKHLETLENLSDYAVVLSLKHARVNGIEQCAVQHRGRRVTLNGIQEIKSVMTEFEDAQATVENYRREKAEILHADKIADVEMRKRVRMGIGRELEASLRKGKFAPIHSIEEWAGNTIGAPLQFFSWIMREKRSMDHGVSRYEECREKQNALHELVPEMKEGRIADAWQRGHADLSPTIDLNALYQDPLKADILAQVRQKKREAFAVREPLANAVESLDTALEALERWCQVAGIVNTDTTEMEMAFLDTFLTNTASYLERNEEIDSEVLQRHREELRALRTHVLEHLNGTMSRTMSAEELKLIDENTIAYVEDTIYSANVEESNIKNIPLFLHTPNINDVRQSSIGDCWLVSAISSVVKSDPEYIRSMFHDLGDGNVLVRLYSAVDKTGKAISYKSDMHQDGVKFIPSWYKLRKQYETGWGNASDCTWVQLLEKAYALGGLNTRNVMEVRNGHVYNVANELTMGSFTEGIAHLTGKIPQSLTEKRYPMNAPGNPDMILTLMAGINAQIVDKTFHMWGNAIPSEFENMDAAIEAFAESLATAEQMVLREAGEGINFDEKAQEYKAHLNRNLAIIQTGDNPEGFEELYRRMKATGRYKDVFKNYDAPTKKGCLDLYELNKLNLNYTREALEFYVTCKNAIDRHGAISVAIPHAVNIIDVTQKDNRLYVMMRDPFNIYNTEYQRDEQGNETHVTEGMETVFSAHKMNRHLIGENRGDILKGGFRGTSWIELNEMFGKKSGVCEVTRASLQQ